jgi:hypothetical protein
MTNGAQGASDILVTLVNLYVIAQHARNQQDGGAQNAFHGQGLRGQAFPAHVPAAFQELRMLFEQVSDLGGSIFRVFGCGARRSTDF